MMNREKIRRACTAALPRYHVVAAHHGRRFYAYPSMPGHSFMAQVDLDGIVWATSVAFDVECGGDDSAAVDVEELGAILEQARAFRVALQEALDADKAGTTPCSE